MVRLDAQCGLFNEDIFDVGNDFNDVIFSFPDFFVQFEKLVILLVEFFPGVLQLCFLFHLEGVLVAFILLKEQVLASGELVLQEA